jgi:hypothetical protein
MLCSNTDPSFFDSQESQVRDEHCTCLKSLSCRTTNVTQKNLFKAHTLAAAHMFTAAATSMSPILLDTSK